jgi:hypothetical protein
VQNPAVCNGRTAFKRLHPKSAILATSVQFEKGELHNIMFEGFKSL